MRKTFYIKSFILLLCCFVLCCCTPGTRFAGKHRVSKAQSTNANATTTNKPVSATFRGFASYYHDKFDGRQTASGEIFNQNLLTAAHKTLPFGTIVRVTNVKNNRKTVVKINDRGPFVEGRIIDLSLAAAKELDMLSEGVVEVIVEVLE